ncbi:hypothetical protein A4X13_0g6611 [Tilletia indica]|uniref:Integrase catalytic domain-containing protein n=1 Tax=Tilletia indica TaxID=43049 RepID=A0A8T8SN56_9BASI|nr:hypothetical protein A4X13_0g6611 [Tilletia indica]
MGIDFMTSLTPSEPDKFDAITVTACKFSKFGIFYPSRTSDTAEDTARRFIQHAYPWTGLPNKLISDRDVRFTSEFWKTMVKELGITHAMSTAYHPQTDGQVERLNQQLRILLRNTIALDQHDWPDKLPSAMMAYNNQAHESTGSAPYETVFGRLPRIFPLSTFHQRVEGKKDRTLAELLSLHADIQDRITRSQDSQKLKYDERHRPWAPKINDWVLVKADHYKTRLDPSQRSKSKLEPQLLGPFQVMEEVAHNAFKLKIPPWFKAHSTIAVQALEPFHGDPTKATPRPITGITEEGAHVERRVLGFLGRRPTHFLDGQDYDYLVKWSGDIQPTWQSDTRLPGLHWATKEFVKKIKDEQDLHQLRKKSILILNEAKERIRALDELEG